MRASWACFATFTFFAVMFGATAASAQTECSVTIPCGGAQNCVFPERLGGETGICVRLGCAGVTEIARLAGACFGPVGDTPREAFLSGDCDGDLVPNGLEPGALCDAGAVISLSLAGRVQWHAPQRFDVAGGAAIAPRDATSLVPDAIGIGCQPSRPCPALPSGPELASRCVYLVHDPTLGDIGVCTYYVDDRDDDSCLTPSFSGDGCLADSGEPHERWEHGDCDADGLINKLDPNVCSQLELMGMVSEGIVTCAHGTLDLSRCTGVVGDITSDDVGCITEARTEAFAPFAYCCRGYEDCPMPVDPSSPSRGRCVFLTDDAMGHTVGACTYVGTSVPDDYTCRAFPTLGPTCMSGEVSYSSWANGHCDLGCDDHANYADEVVCSICPDGDAGMNVLEDAAVEGLDAAIEANDAGGRDAAQLPFDAASEDAPGLDAPGLDAARPPPASFNGSGCRCSLAQRGASSRSLAFLVCLGAVLGLARGALGRRRQR